MKKHLIAVVLVTVLLATSSKINAQSSALPVITNNTPPSVGVFNRYWATRMYLSDKVFTATLSPYDGTNVITGHDKNIVVTLVSNNSSLTGLVFAARSVIQGLAAKATLPDGVGVYAAVPSSPIRASGIWYPVVKTTPPTAPTVYTVSDLMALASTNPAVASVINGLLSWVAAQP